MPLLEIKEVLENEAFECALSPPSPRSPNRRLLVLLGMDLRQRPRTLEISAAQPKMSPDFILPPTESPPHRLQFRIQLPFLVKTDTSREVAKLLHLLNACIEMPGFELHETRKRVFYRYVWTMHPSFISPSLIMSIVSSAMFNMDLFGVAIESLANGQVSFEELVIQFTAAPPS